MQTREEKLEAALDRLVKAAVRLTASARSGSEDDRAGSVAEFEAAAHAGKALLASREEAEPT